MHSTTSPQCGSTNKEQIFGSFCYCCDCTKTPVNQFTIHYELMASIIAKSPAIAARETPERDCCDAIDDGNSLATGRFPW